MQLPPAPRRGEVVKASWGRAVLDYLKSLRLVTGPGSGLASEVTTAGTRVWTTDPTPIWIRLTARDDDLYAWNAVRATRGGTWEDLPAPAGTLGPPAVDAAREQSATVAATPQVVQAWREPNSGRLFFARDTCS